MRKNITIAIDEKLAKEARILAARKEISVSRLLTDFLESIVERENQKDKAKKNFFELTRKSFELNYSRREFIRDSLHER